MCNLEEISQITNYPETTYTQLLENVSLTIDRLGAAETWITPGDRSLSLPVSDRKHIGNFIASSQHVIIAQPKIASAAPRRSGQISIKHARRTSSLKCIYWWLNVDR